MRTPGVVAGLLLLYACSDGAGTTTLGSAATGEVPPVEVANDVAAALSDGDPAVVTQLTDLRSMPWVALAEGATVEQAASLDEAEAAAVAANFWSGFLGSAELGAATIEEVAAFAEGDSNFARLDLPAGSIVLRQSDGWRIDPIASFAAPLGERLLGAAQVIIANRSSEADRLREMLMAERDGVAVAASDPVITEAARATIESVLVAIDSIEG